MVTAREIIEDDLRNMGAPEPTPNIFARQQSIPLHLPQSVALVGCGGVGSWIGHLLSLAGVPKLILFDSDTISETNLNRTPYGPGTIGKPKTEALKALILACRPAAKVECYPDFTIKFAETLQLSADWVVASTDTWASRKDCYQWALGHRVKYLEASAEGEYGSISCAPAEWATIEETQPGYASVPVWVGPSVAAAAMACSHVLHNSIPPEAARLGWDAESQRVRFSYRNE